MNAGVRTVTFCSIGFDRASRMRPGAGEPSGWCTAVFISTTPVSCGTCRSAQPSEIGPPQSWATVTTGPVIPISSVSSHRSSTRVASRRTRPLRSEKPISSWSTAITRTPWGARATRLRNRYDHDGLPWTQSSVSVGSADAVVEHVPGSADAVGARHADEPRPCRVETGETGWWDVRRRDVPGGHHCSSMTPALSPEPMPMHSTRSPGDSVSVTVASVIGIAAGPMLP